MFDISTILWLIAGFAFVFVVGALLGAGSDTSLSGCLRRPIGAIGRAASRKWMCRASRSSISTPFDPRAAPKT